MKFGIRMFERKKQIKFSEKNSNSEYFYAWKNLKNAREPRHSQVERKLSELKKSNTEKFSPDFEEIIKKDKIDKRIFWKKRIVSPDLAKLLGKKGIVRIKKEKKQEKFARIGKIFFRDHWNLLVRSAAENHLRIQKCKLENKYGKNCNLQFGSFTQLKKYQRKVRLFTFSTSSTFASVILAIVIIQIANPGQTSRGATFDWTQNNWDVSATPAATTGDPAPANWTKYQSKDSAISVINGGADATTTIQNVSLTQTSDTDFGAGTLTNTSVNGTGSAASVKLSQNGGVYDASGTFESSIINTGVKPTYTGFSLNPNSQQIGTSLQMQIAGADAAEGPWNYETLGETQAPSGANVVIGLVRQDCTGYSNCYTSLAAWNTAKGGINYGACTSGDLVCADKIAVAKIDGTWTNPDANAVNVDGWTTSANNFIYIYTTAQARHNGSWNLNKYRLEKNANNTRLLDIREDYVTVAGLQIRNTGTIFADNVFYRGAGEVKIYSNIIKDSHQSDGFINLQSAQTGSVVKIWNNLMYDASSSSIYWGFNNPITVYIYNNTIYNTASYGIWVDGSNITKYIKNNIVQNSGGIAYKISVNNLVSANNISQDTSSPDSMFRNKTVNFVDSANKDFHLAANDTAAKDAGADLSADAGISFSNDFENQARSGTWDIGADEYGGGYQTPSSLNGKQYIRYKALFSTTDTTKTSSLEDISLSYLAYPASAQIISSPYNSQDAKNILYRARWGQTIQQGVNSVGFQVRTSPDNSTWTAWMGPDGTSNSEFTDNAGSETMPSAVSDSSNDKWFQYKALLHSDGTAPPILSSADMTYVVNSPPELQNVSASQGSDGKVTITYQLRDPDTTTNRTTIVLKYCTANCASVGNETWEIADTLTGDSGQINNVQQAWGNSYSITWNAKTDYASVYNPNMKIRLEANDGELANYFAALNSSAFILDTKNPSNVAFNIDHVANTVTIKKTSSDAVDDSAYSVYVAKPADIDGASPIFVSSSNPTYPYVYSFVDLEGTLDPATVEVRIRDAYGNLWKEDTNPQQNIETTPYTPQNLSYYDLSTGGSFRMFIMWDALTAGQQGTGGFKQYNIWRKDGNADYAKIATIPYASQNAYLDSGLSEISYKYKITAEDLDDNVSKYSSEITHTPQETGPDTLAPSISNKAVSEITLTSAKISWDTNEMANGAVAYSPVGATEQFSLEVGNPQSYGTHHEVLLAGLSPETHYDIRLKSSDLAGNPAHADFLNEFETLKGPLISDVGIKNVANTQATITWNTSKDSDSHVAYSKIVSNGALQNPVTLGTNDNVGEGAKGSGGKYAHEVEIDGLTSSTVYFFSVSSSDGINPVAVDNNSENFFILYTTLDQTAPVISNLTEPYVSYDTAAISWKTDEPADSLVEYGTESGTYTKSSALATFNVDHFIMLPLLDADKTYYYRVRSKDINGNSDDNYATEKSFKTLKNPQFTHGDLSQITFNDPNPSIVTDREAVISFNTNQQASCFVEYGAASGVYTDSVWENSDESKVDSNNFDNTNYSSIHNIRISNLIFNSPYFYKVHCHDNIVQDVNAKSAANRYKNWVPSIEKTFTTKDLQGSSGDFAGDTTAPTISNINVKDVVGESATITWDTNENASSSVRYGIQSEDENVGGDANVNKSAKNYVKNHSVILYNLIPSTKYLFVVSSVDGAGNLADSARESFSTTSASSISSVNAISKSIGQATISWSTSAETTSIVEYGTSVAYGGKKEDKNYTKDHSVELNELNQGVTYHYRVQGKDKNGRYFASSDNTFMPKSPPKITGVVNNDVSEHGAVISFSTDVPTDANVVYVNVADKTKTGSMGSVELATQHKIELTNLESGATYSVKVVARDENDNQSELNGADFTTGKDENPPKIDQVRTDSALTQSDKVQTIISWKTDEQATTSLLYKESRTGEEKEAKITDNLTNGHVAVITTFKPGIVYFFKAKSIDASGNEAVSNEFALLTPKKKENIIQIIINNFQEIFGWAAHKTTH